MSNLALIQAQRVDFDTCQTCDWLDGLPMIGAPGFGGSLAGSGNSGNGSLSVAAVADAGYGAHQVVVTAIGGGLTHFSVTDPSGTATGQGVVGLPLFAGGITLQIGAGSTPFVVGDTFAIAIVPVPVDLTGLVFDLDARLTVGAASSALTASSAASPASIVNGLTTGMLAMAVPRASLAQMPVNEEGYPYAITATDPVTGLRVPAFYGLIHHVAIPALIGGS